MLSIIICSIKESYYQQVVNNIIDTIGDITYEIIKIDNLKEKLSIAKAYNKGRKMSKFYFLLFVHEDVKFHSINWGNKLIELFINDSKLGMIGIAGSKIKCKTISPWWNNTEYNVKNIIQKINKEDKNPITETVGFKNNSLKEEVVVIDGVFIALKKDESIYFNEKLEGFHNYDQSISIDYFTNGYKIIVTKEILLEHFSKGNINKSWYYSTIYFHDLYKEKLPLTLNNQDIKKEEINNLKNFIIDAFWSKYYYIFLHQWFINFMKNPFNKIHYDIIKSCINIIKNKLFN